MSPTQLNVTIHTELDTPLPARLDPMTLHLYNSETPEYSPFLALQLPETHTNHLTELNIESQVVTISNETELIKWFSSVFDDRNTTLSNRGDTTVHLGALHYDVHLDKTVAMPGLNK